MLTPSVCRNVKGLIGQSISQASVHLPVGRNTPNEGADCKDPIRSSNWKPGWVAEGRKPRFIDDSNSSLAEEFVNRFQEQLSLGSSLFALSRFCLNCSMLTSLVSWGNVPAMDIINLPNNEKDLKTDLSLAFAGG